MTTLAPVTAPVAPQSPHDQKQRQRAPIEYGAAQTHRDLVREKMRVDPAAIAEKKRAAPQRRESEPPPRDDHRGQHVDIRT